MKIKILKDFPVKGKGAIKTGEVLKCRMLPALTIFKPYQVIDGKWTGEVIPQEYGAEIEDTEDKTFTKECSKIENYYKELLDKERNKVKELQSEIDEITKSLEDIVKFVSISSQVSEKIKEWVDSPHDGDEKTDRDNFSIELTKFIQDKLV